MGTGSGSTLPTTRVPSHQLSNGLYVSGHPEQYRERQAIASTTAIPYTGGDVRKSGELAKMFDIPVAEPTRPMKSSSKAGGDAYLYSATLSSGGAPKSTYSGPLTSSGIPRTVENRSGPLIASMVVGSRKPSHSGPLIRGGEHGGAVLAGRSGSGGNSLKNSGPISGGCNTPSMCRQNSANMLPVTGLITSDSVVSGPPSASGTPLRKLSGSLNPSHTASSKHLSGSLAHPAAVNNITQQGPTIKKSVPRVIFCVVIPLFIIGFIAGGFILVTVQNVILLVVVGGLFTLLVALFCWNIFGIDSSLDDFLVSMENTDLRNAKDGQYVKVTGVVTCGNVPLDSSYQRVNHCIYTSTSLYEYRGLRSEPAKPGHLYFAWALRYMERHVVDFYVSDFQSGLRALVKAGYGARVTPIVEESTLVSILPRNKEQPADFVSWMGERKLSCEGKVMCLKEGYIKEGSTVTLFGVVQREENVLMIVPARESFSTGCQWKKLLLPRTVEGLVLSCRETTCKVNGLHT